MYISTGGEQLAVLLRYRVKDYIHVGSQASPAIILPHLIVV
jgi:hypothetical protein